METNAEIAMETMQDNLSLSEEEKLIIKDRVHFDNEPKDKGGWAAY